MSKVPNYPRRHRTISMIEYDYAVKVWCPDSELEPEQNNVNRLASVGESIEDEAAWYAEQRWHASSDKPSAQTIFVKTALGTLHKFYVETRMSPFFSVLES